MDQNVLVGILAGVGAVLGGIEVFRSKGQSLLAWGLTSVSVGLLILVAVR